MYVIPEIETEGFTEHTLALLQEHYKNPRIGTFGLTEDELAAISADLPSADWDLTCTDCGSDLIAIPYLVTIVRSDASTAEELSVLWGLCLEVAEAAKTVISIGDTGIPSTLRPKVRVFPDFEAMVPKLKYLLLDALRRSKKGKAFSKTLANAIQILCEIRSRPGVTTRQLAEKFELSPRSVQRYVETLRVAGEWIEYDARTRGWRLGCGGRSILWDDFDDEYREEPL
ncbi:winged helix-turn-helix transcriptional regulator [uncultured Alistipes sp.]|uniref:winged helix-turn-helix transcriptional regulator n=1 Tax=uncultured Alistipes sp. TaxID=538949 RepID=UPI00272A7C7E|nr:winged helix-turn-helix transcriptional regulator [uncultured Alistipes sp.]